MKFEKIVRLSGLFFLCSSVVLSCGCGASELDTETTTKVHVTKKNFKAKVIHVKKDIVVVKPIEKLDKNIMPKKVYIKRRGYGELKTVRILSKIKKGNVIRVGYHVETSDINKGKFSIYQIRVEKQGFEK